MNLLPQPQMRKNKSFEAEAERKTAEAELPDKIKDAKNRVADLCDIVRHVTEEVRHRNRHNSNNEGGERSGML